MLLYSVWQKKLYSLNFCPNHKPHVTILKCLGFGFLLCLNFDNFFVDYLRSVKLVKTTPMSYILFRTEGLGCRLLRNNCFLDVWTLLKF